MSQPKRLALLVYLATARPRGFHSRDALLGKFWPESDTAAARNSLRQSLHFLRRSLGDDMVISRGDREICLADTAWCDATAFDVALGEGRFEDALRLYRGEFMPGFFIDEAPEAERWLEDERANRARMAVEAAWALVDREEARGEVRAAIVWARQAVVLNPLHEPATGRLIGLLDRAGEPAAAIEVFEELQRRLRAEYELEPSPEIVRQVEALRRRKRDAIQPAAPEPAKPAQPAAVTPAAPQRTDYAEIYSSIAGERGAVESRQPASKPVRTARKSRQLAVTASVLLVLAIGAATTVTLRDRSTAPSSTAVPARTIAVLPFTNLSGSSDDEYFSDGITEEILNRLTAVEGLRVAARSSSFAYKGKNEDVRVVGTKLGVATVLEGSVRKAGNRFKISAQLVNIADGMRIWSKTYDMRTNDVFEVQDRIALEIAAALELEIGAAAMRERLASTTKDAQAYDLYLRGQHLVNIRNREQNEKAVEYFQEAARRDRRFALAYAGLARAYIAMAEWIPPRDVLPMAKQAAQRALQLDSSLVETRLALADVRHVYDRDWAAAELEIQRAIALDPTSSRAHQAYADLLMDSHRFDEALRQRTRYWELRKAQAPDTTLAAFRIERENSWAAYRFYVGDTDQAIAHARAALQLDSTNALAHLLLGMIYQHTRRFQEAVAEVEAAVRLSNRALPFFAHLGRAYAAVGRKDEARALIDTLRTRATSGYIPKDQFALLYHALGDNDTAIKLLQEAVDEYHWWMPNANAHPIWAGLQSDPRFKALMKQLGAPN